jgi:hypothetical protein
MTLTRMSSKLNLFSGLTWSKPEINSTAALLKNGGYRTCRRLLM